MSERLTAQLLAGEPAGTPGAVTERILAIQAQDARGARLAVRARSTGGCAAEVDRALDARELLVTWLNRGTLHLVRSEDYPWLHALTGPRTRTGSMRRLAQERVDAAAAARSVMLIDRWLREDGPLTREAIRERLRAAGLHAEGQALIHLLLLASADRVLVRGPMIGAQHAFVSVEAWLGPHRNVDREAALRELARRYLTGHGPASERDLAYWAGLPLRDARAGFQAIAGELHERPDGLLALRSIPRAADILPPPRLLGPFDPVLHGWASRAWVTGEHDAAVVSGGIFRPFALVDGRAAALWRREGAKVTLTPLAALTREVAAALRRADGEAVLAYLQGDRASRGSSCAGEP